MSLKKFADDTKWLRFQNKVWFLHMHKRVPEGASAVSTAVILASTTPDLVRKLPQLDPDRRRFARELSFGEASDCARVDLDVLRRRVGGPAWSPLDAGWMPRVREILGCPVDTILLSRALRAIPYTGRVTIEVAPMLEMSEGQFLRVIGRGWRIVVGGRLGSIGAPLSLKAAA